MSDTSLSTKGVEALHTGVKALSTLVELINRIKVKADYDVVRAAFDGLDDDSKMATELNTNATKTTTDAGGQLGSSDLEDIQAKVKQVVFMLARNFAAVRMRCDQDSIEVTREEILRATKTAYFMVRVLLPPDVATAVAAKNAELKATNTPLNLMATNAMLKAKHAELEARQTELEVTNAELKAKNAELEARITEMEAESTESECEFSVLGFDADYIYTNQDIYGGGDAPKSHLADAEEYDMVSIEADDVVSIAIYLGSGTREDDEDTTFIE